MKNKSIKNIFLSCLKKVSKPVKKIMKKKTLYIIIALLVLLNIGQFVYFYSVVSDFKAEIKTKKYKMEMLKYKSDLPVPPPLTPEEEEKAQNDLGL